jgi:hypothetical protein
MPAVRPGGQARPGRHRPGAAADPLTCAWQSLGESGQARSRETETEILDALADLGKVQAHTIAKNLGKDYANARKRVAALWTAGRIKKDVIEGKTYYYLPEVREDKEVPTCPTCPTQPTLYPQ